ncbi:SDR family oxidoreductase [Streptomyces sp. ASQP_92]|uniref:SDR family NAD(P)-dependent oxidoreductase n=1 Tax=Streptomyces sp. ASQP_92 TaxID=2979116 RepID=UPI0021BEE699|nr:SDR family oxidoreductase [Streptomyces sp. ASQP_92]MCT9092782.1 SDR family oxidoreductase [Streptomyces sp. ASQP_92]
MDSLNGRKALVTGGSRGIGAATALRLAQEGADVAVTYTRGEDAAREVVAKIEAMGRRGLALRADLADPAAAGASVAGAAEALGGLDILVNNAGVGVLAPLDELTADDVDRVLSVNVRGAFLTAQAAAARMERGGRIITIGSCIAQRVPGPGGTLYALSKSALIGLTKALARELGERGINATLIHPGPIDTDMNPGDGPTAAGQSAMTALGRYGSAGEVASMVAYLASEDAAYVTGAEFAVDGGFAA